MTLMSSTPVTDNISRRFAPLPIPPLLEGQLYQELFSRMQKRGLQYPIIIDENGLIWDGRVRYVICMILGITPRFETRKNGVAAFLDGACRREFTTSERAVILVWLTKNDPVLLQKLQRGGRRNVVLALVIKKIFPDETAVSARSIADFLLVGEATEEERILAVARNGDDRIDLIANNIRAQRRKEEGRIDSTEHNADAEHEAKIIKQIHRLRSAVMAGKMTTRISDELARLAREITAIAPAAPASSSNLIYHRSFTPREYQVAEVSAALKAIKNGAFSVMLEAPTGSGKTVMLFMLLQQVVKEQPNVRILWIAMNWNLLSQAQATNDSFGFVPHANIIYATPFQTTTVKADILVIDEAHHGAARSIVLVREECDARIVIGASATPFRQDHFGLSFNAIVSGPEIDSLIKMGHLSPFDLYVHDSHDVKSLLDIFTVDQIKWGQSLIYLPTCNEAHDLASDLRRAKIKAESVTGEQPRDATLERFRRGEISVICAVNAISEGLDIPSVESVFCRDASHGPVMQMTGRALRPNSNKVARIIQSEHAYPFYKVATPRNIFRHERGLWHRCIDAEHQPTTSEIIPRGYLS